MFTGIVEGMGTIAAVVDEEGLRRLTIEAGPVGAGMRVGDSIAVNGVCLTAVAVAEGTVAVEGYVRAEEI